MTLSKVLLAAFLLFWNLSDPLGHEVLTAECHGVIRPSVYTIYPEGFLNPL